MEKMINIFKTTDKILYQIIQFICLFCFIVLAILVSGNVIVRILSKIMATPSLHWFDEIVEWVFASLIFYGAAALWMTNGHFKLDIIKAKISNKKLSALLSIFVELLVLFFISVFAYQSLKLNIVVTGWTNIFRIPKKLIYLCLSVSAIIMFIYTIKNLIFAIITFFKDEDENNEAESV